MKNITKKIAIASLLLVPVLSFAQFTVPTVDAPQTGVTSLSDISRIIGNVIDWLMGMFFVAATVCIFYAAFLYLTAAGDEEKVGKAKSVLIYAIVAIAVALLAGSVRYIVESVLK